MTIKESITKKSSIMDLLGFIDASPTPYHAVGKLKEKFRLAGYQELSEAGVWNLRPDGKYMTSRNGGSFIVFRTGCKSPEEAGFKIIGAHTDSPHLKLKPNPVYQKAGYIQMGVEIYGSVLLATWTDRDLSLAGRVIPHDPDVEPLLVDIKRPVLRIPQLAIHLNSKVNDKGLILNKQTQMTPILALAKEKLNNEDSLKEWIAQEIGFRISDISGFDLSLYDTQKAEIGGRNGEFLFSARLDNLASCHAAAQGILSATEKNEASRVFVCFDHEEIGSVSAQGAASTFLNDVLERIQNSFNPSREAFFRAIALSSMVSADMAHAVHPNYSDMHDAQHWPELNGGPVIKVNANQRYASDGESVARFEQLCQKAGVPVQKFVNRSDLSCGSTVGPIVAAKLGIRTVDVGNPMLSMHSIRETAGTEDHDKLIYVFREFFGEWKEI